MGLRRHRGSPALSRRGAHGVDTAGLFSGALLGTAIMTAIMEAGQARRITRMSLPYVLGTMVSDERGPVRVYGSLIHFLNGIAFASGYALLFHRLRRAGALLGAGIGVVHGAGVLVALLPIVQEVHPRMADEDEGPDPTPLLQPPGFLALNYGAQTPLMTVAAHAVYGAVVGAAYRPVR
jgi:hypothetical protein